MIYLEKKEEKNGAVDASTRPRTHPSFLGLHACNKMDAWPMDGPILLHARAYLITRKKIAWEGDIKQHQTDIATL